MASPKRVDILAEAQAAWAEAAPPKHLDWPKVNQAVYFTVESYALTFGLSEPNTGHHLRTLTEGDGAKFQRRLYRLPSSKQPQYVYWPKGLPAPDEVGK